jgi:ATP-dependent Clp protease adaptor protein ClpS
MHLSGRGVSLNQTTEKKSTTTKGTEAEGTRTERKTRTEAPWNVILHNDWENSMPRVVSVLVRVIPGMSIKRATKIMYEAHTKGRATVKRCHKELAELYEGQLREKDLTVSIEPD